MIFTPGAHISGYNVTIDENTPVGLTIFRGIQAVDRDRPNSANSDIAVEFFKELRSVANPAGGTVTLPNDMQYWSPGDSGNILFKIRNPLKLFFDDWIPTIDATLPQ